MQKTHKKFDDWNVDKQSLESQERINFPHPREIRSVKLGKNI
jgi:hypothetical protein